MKYAWEFCIVFVTSYQSELISKYTLRQNLGGGGVILLSSHSSFLGSLHFPLENKSINIPPPCADSLGILMQETRISKPNSSTRSITDDFSKKIPLIAKPRDTARAGLIRPSLEGLFF